MSLDESLQKFGAALGLGELGLNAQRTCKVVVQGTVEVTLEEAPDGAGLYLYGEVCRAPEQGREAFFANLLRAQLFGSRTGDACFGLQADTGAVLLIRRLETPGLDADRLHAAFELLVNWLASWRKDPRLGMAEAPPGAPEEPMGAAVRV